MTKLQSKDAIGSPTRFVTSFGKSSHLFREMDWYVYHSLSVRLWAVQCYVVRTASPCFFLRRPPQTQRAARPSRADGNRQYSCYNGSRPFRKAANIHQVFQEGLYQMMLQAVMTTSLAQHFCPALDQVRFTEMSQTPPPFSKMGAFELPLFGKQQIWRK